MTRLLTFSFVAALSWLLTYGIRWGTERRQIMDVPNHRSSHSRPTPRGGGLAIVAITVCGLLIYGCFSPGHWSVILPYSAGAVLIAVVSFFDDLRSLPNWLRVSAHGMSAILAIVTLGAWNTVSLPALGQFQLGWIGLPVTFFWIVGLTNAYNFMDGIDGIAGAQALVAGLVWAVLGTWSGQPFVSALGLLLAASSFGFLGHNWSPARIFMGDVGSAFLGYSFAVLPVIAAPRDPRLVLVGVLGVWPFLFDSSFTFLRRLSHGENVFAAHRSHLYQRLIIVGFSHRLVSSLYIGLAVAGVVLGAAYLSQVPAVQAATALFLPLFCLSLWAFVTRQERKHRLASTITVALGDRP